MTRTRVRYGETDQMGVVYHANYLVYFELGRTELIRDLGLPYSRLEERGWRFFVVDAQLRFHAPARYDEEIIIETRITEVGAVRVRFEYSVHAAQPARLLATGSTLLASASGEGRPRRFPAEFREALLTAAQGRTPGERLSR